MPERREQRSLILSPAPHIHSGENILWVSLTYLAALLPVVLMSMFDYGFYSVRVLGISMASAMSFEWLAQKVLGQRETPFDGTALIAGLVLGLLLPPEVPWWLVVTGNLISIVVAKQIFGGNGGYPFNPALIGWASLKISWPNYMDYGTSFVNFKLSFPMAYPLDIVKKSGMSGLKGLPMMDLFLGYQTGGLGTVYIYLLLIGGLVLILRGVASWRIPVSFLLGVVLTSLLFMAMGGDRYGTPLFHLFTGNVMFGAFFLATDHSTSPVNGTAMLLYGFGCGMFTILFRAWSIYPDGVVFAILLMNILNPILDRIRGKVPMAGLKLEEAKE